MIKETIIAKLKEVTEVENVRLETPELSQHGDYSTNIALQEKREGRKPREYAEEIAEKLRRDEELQEIVDKVEVAGPGFINFFLTRNVLVNELKKVLEEGASYGEGELNRDVRIMFEYGDVNTHKMPHIGHIFSYIYGESMTRILSKSGANVRRVCYQGDVGPHVAKCLWAFKKENPDVPDSLEAKVKLLQKMYREGSKAYEEDENDKKQINKLNMEIYQEEEEIKPLWKKTRHWSIDYYKQFEKRLGIEYVRNYYESEVHQKGKKIVEENVGDVFTKSEGAIIFPGSKYGLHDRVFITGKGTPTYEAKDMYLQRLKFEEWPFDLCVITTASEQNEYFKVIFKALEMINPDFEGKLKHVGFGMINAKSGKMSSREGKVVGAADLIDETVAEIRKLLEKREDMSEEEKMSVAEVVGVGAVKYSLLKTNPEQDITFDIEESISREGNSGPYLQYTSARANSVLHKAELSNRDIQYSGETLTPNHKLSNEELSLIRAFIHFSEIVTEAAVKYAPNLICHYLYGLAQKYNAFYNNNRIIGGEGEELRLALTSATGTIIKNGLQLLGIEAPERM
jgi:arginyl-tRNA synthetase